MSAPPSKKSEYLSLLKYQKLHWFYDTLLVFSGLGKRFKKKITKLANPDHAPYTIVDVGCGTGTQLYAIRSIFPYAIVHGIDPDSALVQALTSNRKLKELSITVSQGFGDQLPFSDGSVDLCYATLVLHHMPTEGKKATLREIFRVLKPGGILLLTDWGVSRCTFLRWLLLFENQQYLDDHFDGLIPEYAEEAGFRITKATRVKPTGMWSWRLQK